VVVPDDVVVPAPVAPPQPPHEEAAPPPADDPIVSASPPPPEPADEAVTLLARAIEKLRHDPRTALRLLDDLATHHPSHALDLERRQLRIDALVLLGDRKSALAELDALDLESTTRPTQLRILRGELRAATGRCPEALTDFDRVSGTDRADYGKAVCLGSPDALRAYLARHPNGHFAAEVRRALGL
jgi:hypothetical protein